MAYSKFAAGVIISCDSRAARTSIKVIEFKATEIGIKDVMGEIASALDQQT